MLDINGEGECKTSLSVGWATPVKIEDLKASLRASVITAEQMDVFQSCVNEAKESATISRLPHELVDMIKDFAFNALHAKLRRQWRIMHQCFTGLRDMESFGTLFRHALFQRHLLLDEFDLYTWSCSSCKSGQAKQDKLQQDLTKSDRVRCDQCQAVIDFSRTELEQSKRNLNWEVKLQNNDASSLFEDWLVHSDAPMETHMHAERIRRFFRFEDDDEHWFDTISDLAQNWRDLIDGKNLFNEEERRLLEEKSLRAVLLQPPWSGRDADRPQVTALLISKSTYSCESESQMFYGLGPVQSVALMQTPPLGKGDRLSLKNALRDLQLTPCETLMRGYDIRPAKPIDTEGLWPQPVILGEWDIY